MIKLSIEYDQDGENPCEYDLGWKLYSFSYRRGEYKNPNELFDISKSCEEEELVPLNAELRLKLKFGRAFIISCYEHGGIQWGLQGEVVQCRWDTSQIAGILIWESDARDMPRSFDKREKNARSFLENYTKWANGQCFYYYKIKDDDNPECNDINSGYYGLENIKASIFEEHNELFQVIPEGQENPFKFAKLKSDIIFTINGENIEDY